MHDLAHCSKIIRYSVKNSIHYSTEKNMFIHDKVCFNILTVTISFNHLHLLFFRISYVKSLMKLDQILTVRALGISSYAFTCVVLYFLTNTTKLQYATCCTT